MALELTASGTRLQAGASILGIPLGGTAPAIIVPSASVLLLGPITGDLVDEPDVKVGAVAGGFAWDGTRLLPRLELHDSVLDGTEYPFLDLTNANAIVASASTALRDAIVSALGGSRTGEALVALLGLGAPASDPGLASRAGPGRTGGEPNSRDRCSASRCARLFAARLGSPVRRVGGDFRS